MATQRYDITERVVSYLGIPSTTNPLYINTKFNYDYAFNGIPFLSATSEAYPYLRQLLDIRKQQIDQSNEPGEQSLSNWWLRSQSTFTGGSGIKFLEPTSDARVMRSSQYSYGLDVWTEGQVSLLNAMSSIDAGHTISCVCFDNSGVEKIITATTNRIEIRSTSGGSTGSITTGFVGSILGVVSIGNGFIFWTSTTSGGIYVVSGALTAATKIYSPSNPGSNAHTIDRVWFIKNRLIVAQTDSNGKKNLTEAGLTTATPTGLSTTHIIEIDQSSWVWSDVTETPTGFLMSGYSGNYSTISKVTLQSSGTTSALTYPVVVAELPLGETVRTIRGYLGSYVGIGTSQGIRVGTIDSTGSITYGPLIVKTTNPVTHVVGFDRFLWFAAKSSVNGFTGTYRVDLSDPDAADFFPYAGDVVTTGNDGVTNMSMLSTGKVVLSTDSGKLWIEGSTKVTNGTLRTGLIRYSTIESKVFKRIRIRGNIQNGNTIVVSSVSQDNAVTSLFTYTAGSINEEVQITPSTPLDCLAFQFDITSTGTSSPLLYSYQIKSLPAVNKGENIQVNLLCFDYETDKHGNRLGVESSSKTRFELLRDSIKNGDTAIMQDLNTGEKVVVVIDGLDFKQTAPPRAGMSGFGGILTITARTIV